MTNAMSHKQPAVYILASKPNGTLYTGVTCGKPWRFGCFTGFLLSQE